MSTILLKACHFIPAYRKLCPKTLKAQQEEAAKKAGQEENNASIEINGENVDDIPEATREDVAFGEGFFVMHLVSCTRPFFYYLSAMMLHEGICDANEHKIFAQAPTSDFATQLGFSSDCTLGQVLDRITRNKRFLKDLAICCVAGQIGAETTGPEAQITVNDVLFSERFRQLIFYECPSLEKVRVRCVEGLDYDEDYEDDFSWGNDDDDDDDDVKKKAQDRDDGKMRKIKPLLHLLNFNREILETHPSIACRGNAARFIANDLVWVLEADFDNNSSRLRQLVFEALELSRKSFDPSNTKGESSLVRCISERIAKDNFKDREALGDYFYALATFCELENSSKRYLLLPPDTNSDSFLLSDAGLVPNVAPFDDYTPAFDFIETIFINGDERFLRGNVAASSAYDVQVLAFLQLFSRFLYLGRMGTEKNHISYHVHPCFIRKVQFIHRYGETILVPLFKTFLDKNSSIPTLTRQVDVEAVVYWLGEIASDVKYEYSWDEHGHGIYDVEHHPRWHASYTIFSPSKNDNNNNTDGDAQVLASLAYKKYGARALLFQHQRNLVARESMDYETRLASYLHFFGDENWKKWLDVDDTSNNNNVQTKNNNKKNRTLQHYPLQEFSNIIHRIVVDLEPVHPTLIGSVVDFAQNACSHVSGKKHLDYEIEQRGSLLLFSSGFLRDFFSMLRIRRSSLSSSSTGEHILDWSNLSSSEATTTFLEEADRIRRVYVATNLQRILSVMDEKNNNINKQIDEQSVSASSSSLITTHVFTPEQQLFVAKIINKFGSLEQDDFLRRNEWLKTNPKTRILFWKEIFGLVEEVVTQGEEETNNNSARGEIPIQSIMEYIYLNYPLVEQVVTAMKKKKNENNASEKNDGDDENLTKEKLPAEVQIIVKALSMFTRALVEFSEQVFVFSDEVNREDELKSIFAEALDETILNEHFTKFVLKDLLTEEAFELVKADKVQMLECIFTFGQKWIEFLDDDEKK